MLIKFAAPAAAALLAAPAIAQEAAPVQPAAPVATPAVEAAPPAPASFALPERDADGRWRTPNAGVAGAEAAWHLRVALNVAALGCRDAAEARTVAGYNALLADRRDALAAGAAASEAAARARAGEGWRAAHDDAMTRLYNFWAQPSVQAAFCREAQAVLAEQASVEPSDFADWAAASLARLEAPFTAFYAEVAAYRSAHAAPTALAAAVTPAVAPAPVEIAAVATPAPVQVAAVSFPVP